MKKYFLLTLLCSILVVQYSLSQTGNCIPASAYSDLDINDVRARILNGGDLWWDLNNSAQYEVPIGSGISSLFAGALWIGGIDQQGQLHVAAQTYRQSGNDFFPGPLDANGTTDALTCNSFDELWKVNKSAIDSFIAGQFTVTPNSLKLWPGKGNPNLSFLPIQDLAPFVDVNGDSLYSADNGDYPLIKGDQAIWCVFNDMGNVHTETGGAALGIEVHFMTYAYNSVPCLERTTFYEYTIFNKSNIQLDSTFMGVWVDPDLGCYTDDYAGCDSTRNLGIIYNSDAFDEDCGANGYGTLVPLQGVKLLEVQSPQPFSNPIMSSFMYYNNDYSVIGNPENATQYYNYLNTTWKDSSHLSYGGNGFGGSISTNYAFSSEPDDPNGWSECALNNTAADRRFILTSGPYVLNPGDMYRFTFAAITVFPPVGTYPCPPFSALQDTADCVQEYFDSLIVFSAIPQINNSNFSFQVFPNPATDAVTITLPETTSGTISVINAVGQMVMEQKVSGRNASLNLNNLFAGIYIVRIHSKEGIGSAMFVKQ